MGKETFQNQEWRMMNCEILLCQAAWGREDHSIARHSIEVYGEWIINKNKEFLMVKRRVYGIPKTLQKTGENLLMLSELV